MHSQNARDAETHAEAIVAAILTLAVMGGEQNPANRVIDEYKKSCRHYALLEDLGTDRFQVGHVSHSKSSSAGIQADTSSRSGGDPAGSKARAHRPYADRAESACVRLTASQHPRSSQLARRLLLRRQPHRERELGVQRQRGSVVPTLAHRLAHQEQVGRCDRQARARFAIDMLLRD
jgi:hypothetical protein